MGRFFNMESPVFVALGRLADIMILNIIFIITCLPVFTIGASCTAMSYMTLKMVRNEETYIVKGYFKSFKENFKQATIIWMVVLVLAFILSVDFQVVKQMTGTAGRYMKIALAALVLFLLMGYVYIFPVLSKFYNSCKNTVKNAFIMAIANFPKTLLLIAIDVVAVAATFLSATTIVWGMLVWLLAGFCGVSYFNSKILVKVFDAYIPSAEPAETEDPSVIVAEDGTSMYEMSAFKNLQPQPFSEDSEENENSDQ